ncbi:alpha/beta hydrolase [Maribacter chungangensis]|uniref:Alpha/beta hydrolase n=1 Tax=Maribacter chungangensis TaxID=1069117 RepID=A0ABW3B0X0_9FLAO
MRTTTFIFFLLMVSNSYTQAKTFTEEVATGYTVIQLHSKFFQQKRTIKVSLPKQYDSSKNYPVIYTLDGNSLFYITSNYVGQLSKLTVDDDGFDYGSDAIPQSIVVGIFHNDRGYETQPNFSLIENIHESEFLEGPEKLKNFLFEEVVPYVDSTYNTSGYNAIIGHSNTAHFVMCLPFQNRNPFEGIISISLTGGTKRFKEQIQSYLEKNESATIFLGYGTKDIGFNELAKSLKGAVTNKNLEIRAYNGNHNEMPVLALANGIKHLFYKYRNVDDFTEASVKKDFDIALYLKQYQRKNKEAYGIETVMKEDDFYTLRDLSIKTKNKRVMNQILEYDSKANGFEQQTHMMFIFNKQIADYEKAEQYANQMLNSSDEFENRILKANLNHYYELFIDDMGYFEKGMRFFEEGKKRFKDRQLEFSYFVAKISIEHNFKKTKGYSNLKYCMKNYQENRYFNELDLERLSDF